jgi:LacI family transcriptional regulator
VSTVIKTTGPERPTLKDVARLAGVHPATASRALSGARTVSPEHARAVQRAARSLNYHVNPIGRALKRRATSTIGMIVPDIENPFFPAMVRNVERALDREGFGLLLCDADNSVEVEAQRMDALLRRQVDSLIISSVHAQDSRKAVLRAAAEVPVVQVDRIVDASTDAVEVDQHGAIEAVIDHLRSTGRRRFAFVTSGEPISPIRGRLDAYRDILAADRAAQRRIYVGDLTLAWGTEAATRMLAGPDPVPDAVICANDLIAVGVMQTLRRDRRAEPDHRAPADRADRRRGGTDDAEPAARGGLRPPTAHALAPTCGARVHRPPRAGTGWAVTARLTVRRVMRIEK